MADAMPVDFSIALGSIIGEDQLVIFLSLGILFASGEVDLHYRRDTHGMGGYSCLRSDVYVRLSPRAKNDRQPL